MTTDSRAARVVSEAWHAALDSEGQLPDVDFFSLGGDSASALSLVARVELKLDIEFPVEILFAQGGLSELVEECEARYDARTSMPTPP